MLASRPRRSLLPVSLQSVVLLASEGETVTFNLAVNIRALAHTGPSIPELCHVGEEVIRLTHTGPEVEF